MTAKDGRIEELEKNLLAIKNKFILLEMEERKRKVDTGMTGRNTDRGWLDLFSERKLVDLISERDLVGFDL